MKGDSWLYALACKNSLTVFLYILQLSMEKMSSRSQHAGENDEKVVQRRWNRLGQFTNNSLREKVLVLKKFEFDRGSSQFEPIS